MAMTLSKRVEMLERELTSLRHKVKEKEEISFREKVASILAHADFKNPLPEYTVDVHWARVKNDKASQRYFRMADAMIDMFGANNVRRR